MPGFQAIIKIEEGGEDTPVSAGREKAPSKRMVLLALFAVEMADDLAADFIQGERCRSRKR